MAVVKKVKPKGSAAKKAVVKKVPAMRNASMRASMRNPSFVVVPVLTPAEVQETIKALGRPRTKVENLPENWETLMIDEASVGGGPTAFMVRLIISTHAFETLLTDSEIFRNTYVHCRQLSQKWWETTGRNMSAGANGNAAAWAMNMTNRFGWKSGRNEVIGDPNSPLQTETKNKTLSKEELIAELESRGLPTSLLKGE